MTLALLERHLEGEGFAVQRAGDALLLGVQEKISFSIVFRQEQYGYIEAKVWVPGRPGRFFPEPEKFCQALEQEFAIDQIRIQIDFYPREQYFSLKSIFDPWELEIEMDALLEAMEIFFSIHTQVVEGRVDWSNQMLGLAFWSRPTAKYLRSQ